MPLQMHPTTRLKFISTGLKTLGAAVLFTMLFANAHAAGLGKLTVFSALGQPLHAEIELTSVSKDDVGTLVPKLASVEAFRQANIEFNPALFSLRFAVEQRAGRQFIRVTSAQPINEPFVDMLVELGGAAGNHLVREYTFLLDPADLRSSQSPQAASPVVLPPAPLVRRTQEPAAADGSAPAKSSSQIVPQERIRTAPRERRESAPAAAKGVTAASDEYQVRQGDSLSRIAGRVKPEGVSLDQMLVALFRANPDAFLGNNMNRLRAGQILTVPDASAAAGMGQGEARGIVVAQAVDFNSYRDKLAGKVAAAAPQKSAEAKQSATGKVTAKVEEQPTAANLAQDKLKLSKSGTATGQDKAAKIGADAEEKIARDKAIAEANSRVKALEKNVSDLQKLLELKDKSLAEQQKQADAAQAALKAATPRASAPVGVKPVETKPAETVPAEVKTAEVKPVPAPVEKPAESKRAPDAKLAASAAAPAASKPKPKPAAVPVPPETSFVDDLLNSELLWPVVGLLLAAFGAFGIYRIRSRRNEQKKNFGDSIITDSSLKANSLFGSTGGQSVDTNNSVFNSNFTPSSHQLDTNEVDPVAEADVYIAYGRDAQAEEILKEALRTQPTRNAVRLKLLEIYSNRKDLRAFEILATELYGMTKGDGEDWIQAASLGIAIDPKNPLYAAGKLPEDTIQKPSALTAPTLPLDEPDLDALLAVTQADASLETINTIEDSSYFGNTAVATEPAPAGTKPEKDKQKAAAEPLSNELDFDLQGISLGQIEVPNTIIRAERVEPKADLDAINFDFLDETTAAPEPVETEAPSFAQTTVGGQIAADDSSHNTQQPVAATAPESPAAMEFDLSGITLELNAEEARAEAPAPALPDLAGVDSHEYSNSAEMATKLDLAVAYQEIGDKEGARELLEEVVKGGTPEQSERARSVLLKLG